MKISCIDKHILNQVKPLLRVDFLFFVVANKFGDVIRIYSMPMTGIDKFKESVCCNEYIDYLIVIFDDVNVFKNLFTVNISDFSKCKRFNISGLEILNLESELHRLELSRKQGKIILEKLVY